MEITVQDGDTLVTKLRHSGGLFLYQRRCLERTGDDSKFLVEHNDGNDGMRVTQTSLC